MAKQHLFPSLFVWMDTPLHEGVNMDDHSGMNRGGVGWRKGIPMLYAFSIHHAKHVTHEDTLVINVGFTLIS